MILWELFLGFLKVGLFAFGGAYGAIPLIRETVLSHGWLEEEALAYMIAVSESTPGPIMVNLATYVGSSKAGLPGALLATAAVVLPSFAVILLVMEMMKGLLKNRWAQAALSGLKPCVAGIVLAAGAEMVWRSLSAGQASPGVDPRNLAVTAGLALLYAAGRALPGKKMSPILLILLAGLLGVIVF